MRVEDRVNRVREAKNVGLVGGKVGPEKLEKKRSSRANMSAKTA